MRNGQPIEQEKKKTSKHRKVPQKGKTRSLNVPPPYQKKKRVLVTPGSKKATFHRRLPRNMPSSSKKKPNWWQGCPQPPRKPHS